MKKSVLKTAIVAALGVSAVAATSVASAGVMSATWTGYFVMLDPAGNALANTSLSSKTNQLVTAVSGTMQFDDVTGAGTATLVPFQFFNGDPTLPASAVGINMQAIGDGMGGPGTLVLGNMLFNWNTNNGIPVSLVMDAAGFFAGDMTAGGPNSAIAASDGTYVGTQPGTFEDANGYLAMGPMPMVTTAWNTSLGAGCAIGACMGNANSGILPLVFDTATNSAYDGANTGGTIGGNPMADGPFTGYNANFNIATITPTGYDANAMLAPNCSWDPSGNCFQGGEVPVPAAVWLFGSGLLGLVGVARRRKA